MKLHIRGLEALPRVAQAKVVDRPGQSVKGLAISLKGYRPQATDHRPQTTGTSSNQKERWIFWWQFMPFWSHLIIYFTLVSSCPMANWSKVLEMAKSPPKKVKASGSTECGSERFASLGWPYWHCGPTWVWDVWLSPHSPPLWIKPWCYNGAHCAQPAWEEESKTGFISSNNTNRSSCSDDALLYIVPLFSDFEHFSSIYMYLYIFMPDV